MINIICANLNDKTIICESNWAKKQCRRECHKGKS